MHIIIMHLKSICHRCKSVKGSCKLVTRKILFNNKIFNVSHGKSLKKCIAAVALDHIFGGQTVSI